MFFGYRVFLILLVVPTLTWAEDNPRHLALPPGVTNVQTLAQNWTDQTSNWFYNVPQGSRLMPYDWFLHLEQSQSETLFRDPEKIRALGYLPRTPDADNPDGLPIGFIDDAPYDDRTRALGVTCAACHTSQITMGTTAYLIDGGPTLGDFEQLLKELTAALRATVRDDAKFERFGAKVLPSGATPEDRLQLRSAVAAVASQRDEYNARNLPANSNERYGPGRVDAFGSIFNEVAVTFLGIPWNWHPANAPVSYPCLWDTPQHDRVQWNGAAENRVSPLGTILFGTEDVGALGRNAGEVLGVFGHMAVNSHEPTIPLPYHSTVNKANLIAIENTLKDLWSPQWPTEALGAIDATMRSKGEGLFTSHCANCHLQIDRRDDGRRVIAQLADVGTDPRLNENFGRLAHTGRLEGRLKTLKGTERFSANEPIGAILKHSVERVLLDPTINPVPLLNLPSITGFFHNPRDAIDSLNPGYRMTATIVSGEKQLVGQFDSLVRSGESGETVTVGGGKFHLMDLGHDVSPNASAGELIDLRAVDLLKTAAGQLNEMLAGEVSHIVAPNEGASTLQLTGATAVIKYKARPLNGVWATAPYLHNGSVPTLAELLKPPAQRVTTFHVGSTAYDAVNIGFVDDPAQPVFNTGITGNSNQGHDFGTSLTADEKRCLLEYLKSL